MDGAQSAIVQFIPIMIIGLVYAVIVFVVAGKRRQNPWPWTIAAVIPLIGVFVSGLYLLLTFLSVLDRLNALEQSTRPPSGTV